MRFFLKTNAAQVAGVPESGDGVGTPPDTEKAAAAQREKNAVLADDHPETETDEVSTTAQAGVQKIEATTKIWSWGHLIAAYALWVSRPPPVLVPRRAPHGNTPS